MRGLAEYAMHGRRQAIIVVLLCGFFPWAFYVSAAIVGLVNLRKTVNEGMLILLWSLLPAGYHWGISEIANITPFALMVGVTGLGQLLKRTDSWQAAIMVSVVLGVLLQLSLYWQTDLIAFVESLLSTVINNQFEQGLQIALTADELTAQWLALWIEVYGAYHSAGLVLCLILARWWQSALYNPGGFQQEFHQLRFDPRLMLALLGLICMGLMAIEPFDSWFRVFCIPPMFGGMALLHALVAQKGLGKGWLILSYTALFLASPVIIILGFLDSVFDLRTRMAK